MFLTNILNFTHKCNHMHVYPNSELAYCPDCGKLIKNEWYITRCNCCGVKLRTIIKNGLVVPEYRYCSNCGSEDFIVEQIESINFIDVNFAALRKVIVDSENIIKPTILSLQEKIDEQPKLLSIYQ